MIIYHRWIGLELLERGRFLLFSAAAIFPHLKFILETSFFIALLLLSIVSNLPSLIH